MSTDGPSIPSRAVPFETASTLPPAPAAPGWTWLSLLLAAAGLASGVLAWNKVQSMQEVLAQQTAQANAQAQQAQTAAKEAQDQVLAANARLTVAEARLAEVSLQRGQLEELVHKLSRTREDTLALDLEAAMRLAVPEANPALGIAAALFTVSGALALSKAFALGKAAIVAPSETMIVRSRPCTRAGVQHRRSRLPGRLRTTGGLCAGFGA